LNKYKNNNYLKEWTITDINVENSLNLEEYVSLEDNSKYETVFNDNININIEVKRNINYFIFKIIIPVFLILSIAWSVMWIPPNQVESRLTTSIVALLALIAYNFVFNEDLPKLSYLTSLDRYILLSYLFCAIPTFLTIYFSRLTKKDYNIALSVNKKSRLLGIIIYGITTTVIFSV
jgi:Neurotransmitter-gated ion-channel transmembrane region.